MLKIQTPDYVRSWKAYEGSLKPEHYAIYLTLQGKDFIKAFSPVTNVTKLINGQLPLQGALRAYRNLRTVQARDNLVVAMRALKVSQGDLEASKLRTPVEILLEPFGDSVHGADLGELLAKMRVQLEEVLGKDSRQL